MPARPIAALVLLLSLSAVPASSYPLDVEPLSDGLYLVRSQADYQGQKTEANGLVVASAGCVALIDTPWNEAQTRDLLRWVKATLHRRVSLAVITHAHADRIGGIAVLRRGGIPTYANRRSADAAERHGYTAPDHLFASETSLSCGALTLDLFYPGPGHTEDNIVVYVRERRTLYGGCFLKSAATESLGNLADADLAAWPASLDALEHRFPQATLVIPGHGGSEPGAIAQTRRLLARSAAAKP